MPEEANWRRPFGRLLTAIRREVWSEPCMKSRGLARFPLLTPSEKASAIVAMVCSDPPEGQARWTVRLITEEAVKAKV